jgi:methylene-tetrahydromethanopterin dehydrogenase
MKGDDPMANRNILHMVTPLKHMSPFDVNMAVDAGYDAVVPYTQVTVEEIRGLVQDAIFSRAPDVGPRTGLFIAGKNAIVALDMLYEAKEAFVPPFALSAFADPAGSFTTAAAMVACVAKKVEEKTGSGLAGRRAAVFGGTGVVGFSAAVLAASEGAEVELVGYDGEGRVKRSAADMQARFNVKVTGVDGSSEEKKREICRRAEVIFCAGPAGSQVLPEQVIAQAQALIVAADVNAVPPAGIAGIGVFDNGTPLAGTPGVGIGALAIGNVKYQTESGLFRQMIASDKPLMLDFRDAYTLAQQIVGA